MAAARSGSGGGAFPLGTQRGVQVGIHCAGDMGLSVHGATRIRLSKVKAAIKNHAALSAGEQVLQLLGRDEGGVHHKAFNVLRLVYWVVRGSAG